MDEDETKIEEPMCKNCRFYIPGSIGDVDPSADHGHCHRYPPRRYGPNDSVFPQVVEDCWCGEWDIIM